MQAEAMREFMKALETARDAQCVGCGRCCRKAPCAVASRVFGPVNECPALVYDYEEKRYYCELCRKPGELGERYREELAVGAGCCSALFNTDRENIPPPVPKFLKEVRIDKQFRAFLHQMGRMGPFGMSGDLLWLLVDGTARELGFGEDWKREVFRTIKEERPKSADEFMGELKYDEHV